GAVKDAGDLLSQDLGGELMAALVPVPHSHPRVLESMDVLAAPRRGILQPFGERDDRESKLLSQLAESALSVEKVVHTDGSLESLSLCYVRVDLNRRRERN